MAKKNKTVKMVIVVIALLIVAYILFQKSPKGRIGNVATLDDGCYPLEEVHEVENMNGQTWVCIIPTLSDGVTTARPPATATSVGSQFVISGTGSGLDGTYTINFIWYASDGRIGCFRVDTPSSYSFNYNATQGGNPRDMTYFGIGKICLI